MVVFSLDGISISKLFLTSLLWLSFLISVYFFVKNYRKINFFVPKNSFTVLLLIISVNTIAIIRSLYFDDGRITTLFGNTYTSLALLTPFFIVFAINKNNLFRIHKLFIFSIKMGIVFFVAFFLFSGQPNIQQLRILSELFLPVIFLTVTLIFEFKSTKRLILFSLVLLFIVASLMSNRTMIIREVMLLLSMFYLYSIKYSKTKISLRIFFISLSIPIYLLLNSIDSGQSFFEETLSSISDEQIGTDTRTFLYAEVFEDLKTNNALIFGKGANGTYYSDFFNQTQRDTDNRLTVEVGLLGILLKTGLVGVILYFLIIITAVYYSLFKSRNFFITGIGLMLGVHFILLFVENLISFSSYNIYIWFFIGICLSKEMRNMSNQEIKALISHNESYQ